MRRWCCRIDFEEDHQWSTHAITSTAISGFDIVLYTECRQPGGGEILHAGMSRTTNIAILGPRSLTEDRLILVQRAARWSVPVGAVLRGGDSSLGSRQDKRRADVLSQRPTRGKHDDLERAFLLRRSTRSSTRRVSVDEEAGPEMRSSRRRRRPRMQGDGENGDGDAATAGDEGEGQAKTTESWAAPVQKSGRFRPSRPGSPTRVVFKPWNAGRPPDRHQGARRHR